MNFRNLVNDLRHRHGNHQSLEDQIKVLAAHHWVQTQPSPQGPYLKKSELEDTLDEMGLDLECNLGTSLQNLRDAGFLSGFQPDDLPDWFIIRQRDDEFVMGDDVFPPAVHEECRRALRHVQEMDPASEGDDTSAVADGGDERTKTNDEGETLREEVARSLDINPSDVEPFLLEGSPRARRSKLNDFVEAVVEGETFDKPDSYDKISLIPCALRYHRTEWVLDTYYT